MIWSAFISMLLGALCYCFCHERCVMREWLEEKKRCVDKKIKEHRDRDA